MSLDRRQLAAMFAKLRSARAKPSERKGASDATKLKTSTMLYTNVRKIDGIMYDIAKLHLIVAGRNAITISMPRIDKSRRTGFSSGRYQRADVDFPILIGPNGIIVDGRHRAAKLSDKGHKTIQAIVISQKDLDRVRVKAPHDGAKARKG